GRRRRRRSPRLALPRSLRGPGRHRRKPPSTPCSIRRRRTTASSKPPRNVGATSPGYSETLRGGSGMRKAIPAIAIAVVLIGLRVTPGVGEQPWRVAGVAKTGRDGLVRIPARPGAYLVAARADGFAPARKEFIRASGDPVTRVELDLSKGVSLAGRTVSKGGREPVSLAQVTVVDMPRTTGRGQPGRPGPFRVGPRAASPIDEVAPVEERSTATSDQDGRFR